MTELITEENKHDVIADVILHAINEGLNINEDVIRQFQSVCNHLKFNLVSRITLEVVIDEIAQGVRIDHILRYIHMLNLSSYNIHDYNRSLYRARCDVLYAVYDVKVGRRHNLVQELPPRLTQRESDLLNGCYTYMIYTLKKEYR